MPSQIHAIRLNMPLKLGMVNCYLIDTGSGFILIDTGSSNQRRLLDSILAKAGCAPGNLRLILITHGDYDHTGNAAYLRSKYGAKIAMGRGDSGMLERGDMFFNRKQGNPLVRILAPLLMGFGKSKRCTADLFFEEGANLLEFGLDARIFAIPGHSQGSIALLTVDGDLFCGDLLDNIQRPSLTTIMDDPQAGNASLERLRVCRFKPCTPVTAARF